MNLLRGRRRGLGCVTAASHHELASPQRGTGVFVTELAYGAEPRTHDESFRSGFIISRVNVAKPKDLVWVFRLMNYFSLACAVMMAIMLTRSIFLLMVSFALI